MEQQVSGLGEDERQLAIVASHHLGLGLGLGACHEAMQLIDGAVSLLLT